VSANGKEDVMKRYLAIGAAVVVAGCGADERLTKAETAQQLNGAVATVNAEFQAVFERLGRSREDARVPVAVRELLADAAAVERRTVETLAPIEPVEDAEPAVDDFIRAARTQADRLEDAAARPDLTVAEMADAVEHGDMRAALLALERQGLVEAPGHE
jgi:hypothetical protein